MNTMAPITLNADFYFGKTDAKQRIGMLPYPWPGPWPGPCPGGIRGPHFHFGDDIFVVDTKIWGEFSGAIVKEFQTTLKKAKNLNFEATMEIGQINEMLM